MSKLLKALKRLCSLRSYVPQSSAKDTPREAAVTMIEALQNDEYAVKQRPVNTRRKLRVVCIGAGASGIVRFEICGPICCVRWLMQYLCSTCLFGKTSC